MTQKTISLPEKLYQKLKSKKKSSETFSKLIQRLIHEEENSKDLNSFQSFAGVLEDNDEWDDIEIQLRKMRQIPRKSLDIMGD